MDWVHSLERPARPREGDFRMELQSKPDFAVTLERFEAWWRCELIDRPLVSMAVHSDRPPVRPVPTKEHASLRDRWLDIEYHIDRVEAWVGSGVYLGDSFPMYMPNLGPEIVATLFGSDLEFSEDSTWSTPIAGSCAEILGMQPDFETAYWRILRAATEMSVERGRGKWITGITDLHTNADLLAALREPQDLCLECLTDPETVAAADRHVTRFFRAIYDDLHERIAPGQEGISTSWTPALHQGRMYNLQSDFICMISPEQFQEIVLPDLVAEMKLMDRSIFHIDGPAATRHLDALLACPELDGLQWVCGAGNGPASRWAELYQRVQAAGKCIQVLYTDMNDAKELARQIRPEGVWFCLEGVYSRAEAEAFLSWLERWAAGKRV